MILRQNNSDNCLLEEMKCKIGTVHLVSDDTISIEQTNAHTMELTVEEDFINKIDSFGIKNVRCGTLVPTCDEIQHKLDCKGIKFSCEVILYIGIRPLNLKNLSIKTKHLYFNQPIEVLKHYSNIYIKTDELKFLEESFDNWRESTLKYLEKFHPKKILVDKNPTNYKKLLHNNITHVENLHEIILNHGENHSEIEFHHWKANYMYLITKNKDLLERVYLDDDRGFYFGKKPY